MRNFRVLFPAKTAWDNPMRKILSLDTLNLNASCIATEEISLLDFARKGNFVADLTIEFFLDTEDGHRKFVQNFDFWSCYRKIPSRFWNRKRLEIFACGWDFLRKLANLIHSRGSIWKNLTMTLMVRFWPEAEIFLGNLQIWRRFQRPFKKISSRFLFPKRLGIFSWQLWFQTYIKDLIHSRGLILENLTMTLMVRFFQMDAEIDVRFASFLRKSQPQAKISHFDFSQKRLGFFNQQLWFQTHIKDLIHSGGLIWKNLTMRVMVRFLAHTSDIDRNLGLSVDFWGPYWKISKWPSDPLLRDFWIRPHISIETWI